MATKTTPAKKPAKKVTKVAAKPTAKPAKTTAARSAKTATTRTSKSAEVVPARGHSVPRLWALAAYVAAAELARAGVKNWDANEAAAGRILALRAEGVAAQPTDETFKIRPRPSGFTTWGNLADRLADAAIWGPHRALGKLKGSCRVSPYAVVIADDEGHALFDPRGRLPSTAEMIASVDTVGVLDALKVQPIVEKGKTVDYVGDGRQRLNTVHRVNERRVRIWHSRACSSGRADVPPELIVEVPIEVLGGSVAEAQRAGGVLNAAALRKDDKLRDLAHRAPQLRKSGYTRDEIAVQLGVSVSSVTNLLALQQLAPSMLRLLWAEKLPPACAYILATQEEAHQVELWDIAQLVPGPRRTAHLRLLVAAEARVEELQAVVDGGSLHPSTQEVDRKNLAAAKLELEQLRAGKVEVVVKPRRAQDLVRATASLEGLEGEGPRLVKAALAFASGGSLDDLLALLRASSATVVGPLGIDCPVCCVDPGHACAVDDEADIADYAEVGDEDVVTKPGEFHRARIEEAQQLGKKSTEVRDV